MKRLAVALIAVALLLAGCALHLPTSTAGTVSDRYRRFTGKVFAYHLCIRPAGGGSQSCGLVERAAYNACHIGQTWPDCKDN